MIRNPAYRYWPKGLPHEVTTPRTSLCFNLASATARFPDKPAVVFYDRIFTYAQVHRDVDRLAGFLRQRMGVGRGDRVLLLSQNCPQFLIGYYAIMRAGAAVVPVNAMSTADEVAYYAANSGARAALVAEELLPALAPCLDDGRVGHAVLIRYADALPASTDLPLPDWVRGGATAAHAAATPWAEALAAGCEPGPLDVGSDDLCALPYTSGTTGHPKGCMHTHGTLTAAIYASALWRNLNSESVFLAVAPLFHLLGMQNGMNLPLLCGGTIVMLPRWDRVAAARLIDRYRVSVWAAPPTMLVDFFAQDGLENYDLDCLAMLSGGGAAMPEAVAAMLAERYGLYYNEAYGMTETASFLHGNPPQRGKRQCLGVATFGVDSRIVDPETLEELPPGQTGELITAAAQVMKGYWQNPEANAQAFIERDGKRFLRTGDLASMDEDGYYFMQDRLKRMISASGYKVWPAEVENILYGHPAIHEACVIAAADTKRGETVKAVISLKPEARGKVSAADIEAWSRERMAAYKVPRIVEFVAELPKSNTGKVMWRALQEQQRAREQEGNTHV